VVSPDGGGTCYRADLETARSQRASVATIRAASCPGQSVVDVGYDFFVVFVHGPRETNDRSSLVLQFIPKDIPTDGRHRWHRDRRLPSWMGDYIVPTIRWSNGNVLNVSTRGVIEQLLVERSRVDGIKIQYGFLAGRPPAINDNMPPGAIEIK
jgi:hypothetical protein